MRDDESHRPGGSSRERRIKQVIDPERPCASVPLDDKLISRRTSGVVRGSFAARIATEERVIACRRGGVGPDANRNCVKARSVE